MLLEELSASTLVEALPDPVLVIGTDGGILGGNAAANALLATERVPVGGNIVDFLPEQEHRRLDPLVWLRRWAEQPQAPELAHVWLLCRDRNGVEKPVRVRVGRLPTRPVSYLVMLVDVTEEQARQHRARSAGRLAARLLEISADAIVNVDENLTIVYANPSAERLFRHPPGSLPGQNLAVLIPERFHDQHRRFMEHFAAAPEASRLMGQRNEIRGITRDGEELTLEASITKVTMDQGLIFSASLREVGSRATGAGAGAGAGPAGRER